MRDYEEVAKRVLARRDAFFAARSRKRRRLIPLFSVFFLAVLCFGAWRVHITQPPALQSGTAQLEWVRAGSDSMAPITPLTELHTPAAIFYIQNGKVKTTFTPEDEAFGKILRLNAKRDALTEGGSEYDIGALQTTLHYEKTGAYLLYRYPEGSYGDILFCLADSAAPEQYDNWFCEISDRLVQPYARFAPADELLTFLTETEKKE